MQKFILSGTVLAAAAAILAAPPAAWAAQAAPAIAVAVAETSPTQATLLHLTVTASGTPAPTGTVTVSSGTYRSAAATLSAGKASIAVPAVQLSVGRNTLVAAYTPDAAVTARYKSASGSVVVKVAAQASKVTPTVTVTPAVASILTIDGLKVNFAVTGPAGDLTPAGTVTLTLGNKKLGTATLASGKTSVLVAAGVLLVGKDTLTATYTPDVTTGVVYTAATGKATETVLQGAQVVINQAGTGVKVSNQLLGMNMPVWFDPTKPAVVPAFKVAGITGIRWPGGTVANVYHWATNSGCNGQYTDPNATFDKFVSALANPAAVEIALTANYGSNEACDAGGDPNEAAAWIARAKTLGANVTRMTIGNEDYGFWEEDLHPIPHDPTTYAEAVATGFYPAIKAVNPNVLVGVNVDPGQGWDETVLAKAKYDYVEFHYYATGPGIETDPFLVDQGVNKLILNLNLIKQELAVAGKPNTPIYIGEIGSTYALPGKQSTSITQALFAAQSLGEMMNRGVVGAAWWLGFGHCDDASSGANFSSSLYGWQNFGGYMTFSDGTPEYGCSNATAVPIGTLLPTARAYQMFKNVAISGEEVLGTSVVGDTTDVRAYAATHSGGTAVVLLNLNQTATETVRLRLSKQTQSSTTSLLTYSRAIYDLSQNNVWAGPTGRTLGAENLPLTVSLPPWSINVITLK